MHDKKLPITIAKVTKVFSWFATIIREASKRGREDLFMFKILKEWDLEVDLIIFTQPHMD